MADAGLTPSQTVGPFLHIALADDTAPCGRPIGHAGLAPS